jgi:hypothetical protein
MKAISIRQPWAWAIVHGHKPVENRTWQAAHRGPLLIHAGLQFDDEGLHAIQARFPAVAAMLPQRWDLGGIVGTADVVDCVSTHASAWFTGPWGLVLHNARPLPFVPYRGVLGLFDVPDDAVPALRLHTASAAQAEAEAGQQRMF